MRTLALALIFVAAQAAGQSFPSKPVKLMVGVPPGGPTDTVARAIAPDLSEALGQPVVVENRAGASAVIATDAVAKSAPDGYTLAFIYITHATNPTLMEKLPYDTLRDFAPVSMVGWQSMVLLAHPSFAPNTVQELIGLAKAQPGKLDYGASDSGSAPHLAGELFKMMSGTDLTPVYYKGTAPALTDLMSGQIQLLADPMLSSLPLAQGGKIKALGITSLKRQPAAPEIPTVEESGMKGFEFVSWYGLWGPKNLPADVSATLQKDIADVMAQPEVKQRMTTLGFEVAPSTASDDFAQYIASEMAKYEKIIKDANIKVP
jgi:tripartite-type tricarboxylate transporter receptor subunit TctC